MGLMISSIAEIGKSILPKNMFKANSDYFLYILEYSDFDFQETHDYSSELHSSGMSRILNSYQYNSTNLKFKKLKSQSFHSDKVMSWRNIFDIVNLNSAETKPATITPAFLFTTIQPNKLNKISFKNITNDEFIFLKFRPQDRDANKIPQLVNEMLSSIGQTVSNCNQSSVTSQYKNVHVFDYFSETLKARIADIKAEIIMGDKIEVRDISNNSGQIIVGRDNKEISGIATDNDELAEKSLSWTKWGVIIATLIGVAAIIATIIYS